MLSRPYTIDTLLAIMQTLRDPQQGCPWDQKQHWQSIVPHTIEEAYELADAIEQALAEDDFSEVRLELGDLLFQVVFYAQFAKEQARFEFSDVIEGICEKLIRRHPHVFAQQQFADEAAIGRNWEQLKAEERAEKSERQLSVLADVPMALPALSRAQKLQKRCAHIGFDWPGVEPVLDKVEEELAEVKQALAAGDQKNLAEEIGDLLFSCVNLARATQFDAEELLRQANQKFTRRFQAVELLAKNSGKQLEQMSLEEMDLLWDKVKENYKN